MKKEVPQAKGYYVPEAAIHTGDTQQEDNPLTPSAPRLPRASCPNQVQGRDDLYHLKFLHFSL